MTDVSLRHLSKRFDDVLAVRDLNLNIESGEMVAFLGPSGCGKTTMLRMITGLIDPTSGDVLFDGKSVLNTSTEKRGAVMVFQKHLLFPTMNVAQNVGFGLKMEGVPKAEIDMRVAEMLELVELPGIEDRKAHELSGGQQQRIALARALIVHPKVLLLDEPLANLDANLRITMRHLIRTIQRELGITAIFVTHDQEEAVMLADRVALMLDGVLQQVGDPADFYRSPRTASVARFFRDSNFLSGERIGSVVHTSIGEIIVDESFVRPGDGPVVITVRPEEIELVEGQSSEPNIVDATLKTLIYMGSSTRLVVELGDATWQVQGPAALRIPEGEVIQIRLPIGDVWIVEDDDETSGDSDTSEPAPEETVRSK